MNARLAAMLCVAGIVWVPSAAAGVDVFIIEQSGFFGAPGIVPGTIGRLNTDDVSNVTIVADDGPDFFNYGGIDFRRGFDQLFGFETTTNSLRELPLTGGNLLIDSLGHVDNLVSGLTYSNDGSRVFAVGNVSAFGRIVEADPDTGQVIEVHNFLNVSISGLATVPECTDLPFPPGELWGVNNTVFGPRMVRFNLETDTVIDVGAVLGLDFTQAFDVGLDWAADGTLYAAFQGVDAMGVDISARLYTLDVIGSPIQANLLGVIQAEDTWDIASIVVDDRVPTVPGDVDGSGCVDLDDLTLVLQAFGSSAGDAAFNRFADFDQNCTTDLDDLTILLMNFGQGCG
jgi:hypothetical protein